MTTSDEIEADKRSGQPSLVGLVLFFAMQGIAVILVGFAALFLSFEPVWSAERVQAAFVKPGDARSGSLLLKTDDGYADAPRLGIDVDLTVSGPTVRARVTQMFRNPTKDWVEAVYVYPLPSGGAVDTLKMVIGDRVVVGEIKERAAGQDHLRAGQGRTGKRRRLTEQERPNIFTNSVANIGPRRNRAGPDRISGAGPPIGNEFSLRVPMVVAPRYNPAPIVQRVDFGDGGGWGGQIRPGAGSRPHLAARARSRDQRPDQSDPTSPCGCRRASRSATSRAITTPSRPRTADDSTRVIDSPTAVVPAARDFELTWKPAAEKAPSVGLFREHVGDSDYLLAFVTPPSVAPAHGNRCRATSSS